MSDWTITVSPPNGVQDTAAAFEEAWLDAEGAEIDGFLPLPSDPQYDRILRELVRLDLRLSWAAGKPRLLADYEEIYPLAFEDKAWLTAMSLEEYRARTAAGETVTPGDYARRFGVDVTHWRAKRTFLRPTSDPDDPRRTAVLPTPPLSARRTVVKTLGTPALPKAGQTFLEFDLVRELGRGVFGRVFLARQKELAGRPVALKVTTEVDCEPQTLARLQHTNIVPIHSVARHGPLQAICMPYFGSVTLAQVIRTVGKQAELLTGTGRRFLSTLFEMRTTVSDDVRQATGAPAVAEAPAPQPEEPASLKALADMTPVQVALWIGARLADGLAHAHERGVLHCDLKPANILLADDGQPMLLDFNVSTDRSPAGKKAPRLGGTLPYMAPEHLDVIGGKAAPLTAQCDLYSLGVVLYELLTGAHPFEEPNGEPASMVRVYKDLHSKLPPAPSTKNKAITPAADAIILKLLEPDPARRYAEAAHLREDLERQLTHRPLRYARDPSVAERVRKWRRRNPRLSVGLAVALGAFAFLIAPATVVAVRQNQLAERRHEIARSEAVLGQQRAVRTLRLAQTQMSGRAPEKATMQDGLDRARGVLDEYAVAEADWADRSPVALLSDRQRAELRTELGETLLLMARAEQWLAADGDTAVAAAAALVWNQLAERCYPADARPRAVARQRNKLLALTGGGAEALPEPAAGPADAYHEGLDLALAGEPGKALAKLIPYTDEHPDHFLAWYARGACHAEAGQYADSAAAFTVCATLMPDFAPVYFSRGFARHKQGKPADAEADFTRALDRKPNWIEARTNRGIARRAAKDYAGADADLTAVLESSAAPTRLYFLRAQVRRAMGNAAAAEADMAEGRKRTPADEKSWQSRGVSLLLIDPRAALADYEEALKLNPKSKDALMSKALVLGEQLKRPADAVKVMDELLTLYPMYTDARASRGVILARIGDAKRAREDVAAVLRDEPTPYRLFQMAGVYAQLSKTDRTAASKQEALKLLAQAFRSGFSEFDKLTDKDLDPIRDDPTFQSMVDHARQLRTQ